MTAHDPSKMFHRFHYTKGASFSCLVPFFAPFLLHLLFLSLLSLAFASGNSLPSAGTSGYSLSFDGKSYASILREPNQDQSFRRGLKEMTISLWLSTQAVTSAQQTTTLLDSSVGKKQWRLSLIHSEQKLTTDLQFRLGERNGDYWDMIWSPNVSIKPLTWTHIAVVWSSRLSSALLYKNGVLVAEHVVNTPIELNPAIGDVLLGASSTDSYETSGEVEHNFVGSIDEVQVWYVARHQRDLEGTRAFHRHPKSSAAGLVGYWRLDEGTGSCSANVIDGWYGEIEFQLKSNDQDESSLKHHPKWIVSNAGVGDQVEQLEDVDTRITLNSTDSAGRDLEYVVIVLPTKGYLWEYSPSPITNNGSSSMRGMKIQHVPHVLPPAEISYVVYTPDANTHSSILDTFRKAVNSYADFSFRVQALNDSISKSPYPGTVHIYVDPVDDPPQFVHPPVVTMQFADYGVDDPDSWERKGGDFIDVTLSITDTKDKDSIAPLSSRQISAAAAAAAADLSVMTAAVSSSNSRISLGTTNALDFGGPKGYGDGKSDAASRFSGSLSNVNNALNDFTLSTPALFGGTVSLEVDDQGEQGRGGSLKNSHAVELQLRSGSIPVISDLYPPSAPPVGGEAVLLTGTNFHLGGSHVCVFGSIRSNATLLASAKLRCLIPPSFNGRIGLTSLLVINEAGFSSNTLQFLYEMPPTLIKINPASGPTTGGTSVLVLGDGFSQNERLACRFGSTSVLAQFVSNRILKCLAPERSPVDSVIVDVAVANNGLHFGTHVQFTYDQVLAVTAASPSRGPADGQSEVNVEGTNFQNSTLLACRFSSTVVLAVFSSTSSVTCVVPSAKAHGSKSLPFSVSVSVANNGHDFVNSHHVVYTYVSPTVISHLTPKNGPVEGGTAIFIHGNNFVASSGLSSGPWCRFGTVTDVQMILGIFLSSNTVRCITPMHAKGRVPIEITTNGVDFTSNGIQFEYEVQAAVFSVSPSFGPITGGTRVVISGIGFSRTSMLQCRFGEEGMLVVATWVTSTVVECVTPAVISVQVVPIEITSNKVDFTVSSDNAMFSYMPPVRVINFSPSSGPSRGGTVVTVVGAGFSQIGSNAQLCKCRFGPFSVRAVVFNSTHIRCTTPAQSSSGPILLDVSINGVQFTDSQKMFAYYGGVRLTSISPKSGPQEGGTLITVRGAGFVNSTVLSCFVSKIRISAIFEDSTKVLCLVPPFKDSNLRLGVSVTVSNNGVDHSTGGALRYVYQNLPTVTLVSPNFGLSIDNGATVLTVQGMYFANPDTSLFCRVGRVQATKVQYLSSKMLLCTFLFLAEGVHNVSVSSNGFDYSVSHVEATFQSLPPVSLVSMYPTNGSLAGGTNVHFHLNASIEHQGRTLSSAQPYCQFGNKRVVGVWTKPTAIKCVTPAVLVPASIRVSVSVNGQDLVRHNQGENILIFTHTVIPRVQLLTPKTGPTSGGTSVYLIGSVFERYTRYFCKFGVELLSPVVEAQFSSASLIRCIAPSAIISGPIELQLSVNNIDFLSTGMTFFYSQPLEVGFLSPSHGPVQGGTQISITGSQFPAGEELLCKFVDKRDNSTIATEKAAWISEGTLMCTTPPVTEPHTAEVQILNQNTKFTESNLRFNFFHGPEVHSLQPLQGSTFGGSTVFVTGKNFANKGNTWCRFGKNSKSIVPATFKNEKLIECVTPAQASPGEVCIEVSNNNVDFSGNCVKFEFTRAARVTEIQPKHGPKRGGTRVTVTGKHFRSADHMRCRFGNVESTDAVEIISNDTIVCMSPSSIQDYVSLEISNNQGVDYSQSGLQYVFLTFPVLNSLYPKRGPESGGTTLMIGGTGFYNSVVMSCVFFDTHDDPSATSSRVESVATWISSSSLTCVSPSHRPSTMRVAVTSNGQQYTTDELYFEYHSRIGITSLSPSRGSLHGGTEVFLSGSGFINSTRLSCRFGETITLATYVNETLTMCSAPAVPSEHSAFVQVSNNGIDFSSTGKAFQFLKEVVVTGLSPRSGPSVGGTKILFSGSNFQDNESLKCHFTSGQYTSSTVAKFVSHNAVTCSSPRSIVGPVDVSVSRDFVSLQGTASTFIFYENVVVQGLSPASGTEKGNTPVVILGSNFLASDLLKCKFGGSTPTAATWISSRAIRCLSPTNSPGSIVAVEVSNNGIDFTTNHITFSYSETLAVSSVTPNSGPTHGGTRIRIFGSGLSHAATGFCKFGPGSQPSRAIQINNSSIECVTPAQASPGEVCIEVSNNNVDFSGNCVKFEFTRAARVTEIQPKHGPKRGGTRVTVTGKHFRSADHMRCRFGNVESTDAVEIISNDTIVCMSPSSIQDYVSLEISNNQGVDYSQSGLQYVFLTFPVLNSLYPKRGPESGGTTLMIGGTGFYNSVVMSCVFFDTHDDPSATSSRVESVATWISSSSLTCVSPSHRPSTMRVAVTSNGQQYTTDELYFEYHSRIGITSLSPSRGSLHGGTEVFLSGSGFINSTRLSCRFGKTITLATYISNASISFITPPQERGHVDVEVSNNGIDYSVSTKQFECIPSNKIIRTSPRSGPTTGGTRMMVDISDLTWSQKESTISCLFDGRTTVDGQYAVSNTTGILNITRIACFSPASETAGLVAVKILIGGLDISGHASTFTYYDVPKVTKVLPSSVQVSDSDSGVSVTVHGTHFKNTETLFCRFGNIRVTRAMWLAAGLLECLAPSMHPGLTSVDVSLNGVDYTNSQTFITYIMDSVLISIEPTKGRMGGGEIVEVIGTGFLSVIDSARPMCIFGAVHVPAFEYNMTHLKCIAPAAPSESFAGSTFSTEQSVHFDVMSADLLQSTGILTNQHHHEHGNWFFSYIPETTVLSVSPAFGPHDEATLISVSAVSVPAVIEHSIFCVFEVAGESQKVPTLVRTATSTSVQCITPLFTSTGVANVRIAIGAATATTSSAQFTVHGKLNILDIVPFIGSESGGTKISLSVDRGYGPTSFIPLVCIFGEISKLSHAKYIANNTVECISPANSPGTVRLTLATRSGKGKRSNAVDFRYHETITTITVSPRKFDVRGGTEVEVLGTNFVNTSMLACRFGMFADVPASFISATQIRCTSPFMDTNEFTSEVNDFLNAKLNIYVTANGIEWSSGSEIEMLHQNDESELRSIAPSRGPSSGGTLVTITISNEHKIQPTRVLLSTNVSQVVHTPFSMISYFICSLFYFFLFFFLTPIYTLHVLFFFFTATK